MATSQDAEVGDEIVHVPVPRRYLAAVYRALAAEMGGAPPVAVPAPPPARPPAGQAANPPEVPWSAADLARLKGTIRTPTPRVVLDLTTRNVGQRVMLDEVAKEAGRTRDQARADLGGFTQLVRRRFGRNNWPFSVEYDPAGRAAYYCDSTDVARWWNEGATEQT